MAVLTALLSLVPKALILLTFIVFIAFLGYCLFIKYIHMKYDHIPGPPRDSFFFGHSSTFVKIMRKGGVTHERLKEWAETHGPVYRINILHWIILCITCPEATKEILMSHKYPKTEFIYKRLSNLFGQRFLGNGLLTALDHGLWHKQRRLMNPAFYKLYLRGLMGAFNEKAEDLMDKLADDADNNTVANMQHLANLVTLDVIAKTAFGVDLKLLTKSSPFSRAIEMCLKGLMNNICDALFEFNPHNRPFVKEVREACCLLRTTGAQWILDRKTAMQNGEDVPKDILTQLIKSAATEKNMSGEGEKLMLDNFVTIFIGGHHTTANAITFCIMELARHPEILDKVRKEVDNVIGMKYNISYEDLGKLTYLSQVLKETLRLYPTAPAVFRKIPEDTVIDGLHVPGGVSCIFSSYVAGRLEKFFKEPLTFDPARFHPDAPKPYYCYYPFGLGPRACLGEKYSLMEAKVVMVKLVQRFDFTLAPGQTFDIQDSALLGPKNGLFCFVKHRK